MKKNRIDEGETGGRGSVNDAIAAAPAGVLRPGPVTGLSDSYALAFVVGFFVLFSLFWLILWGAQQGDEAKDPAQGPGIAWASRAPLGAQGGALKTIE